MIFELLGIIGTLLYSSEVLQMCAKVNITLVEVTGALV